MSEIDAVLYEYVKFIHVIYGSLSVSGFNRFMHFLSTYANSWIKIAARRTLFDPVWFPVGIRRRVGPGMALTTIGEVPQWGGVADWSSCRTVEAVTTGAACGSIRRRPQMREWSDSPAAWWVPSQPQLIGDEIEINSRTDLDGLSGSATARRRIEQRHCAQGWAAVLFKATSHTAAWAEGEWFPSWRES